ncbi:MAG TPA: LysM domain-containing protein [Verrucomicrobiae bacterium]|nr:LysM domain-containing protein [Verrucomicrobiae bacterium]
MNTIAQKPATGVAGASAEVAQLEAAERRVKIQLAAVLEQLKDLDARHVPDSHPWLTFKTVNSIEELKSAHGSLRSALKQDISELQATFRQLESELRAARRQSSLSAIKGRENLAAQHYHDFELKMRELLTRWKNTGIRPEAELEHLLGVAEKVMKEQVVVLDSNPSRENMRAVLTSMKNLSLFGKDTPEGWSGLQKAANKRLTNSVRSLKANVTRANLANVLNAGREAELLGCEHASEESIGAALAGAVKLREATERQFRSIPSVTNFMALFKAQHDEALLGGSSAVPDHPQGLQDAPRGTIHLVKAGDTLSGLSQRYFGKACYWDVILWRNVGLIRDPNHPPIGRTLTIA